MLYLLINNFKVSKLFLTLTQHDLKQINPRLFNNLAMYSKFQLKICLDTIEIWLSDSYRHTVQKLQVI